MTYYIYNQNLQWQNFDTVRQFQPKTLIGYFHQEESHSIKQKVSSKIITVNDDDVTCNKNQ